MNEDMEQKVRILNLEDNPNDAELNRDTLAGEGIACETLRVDTRETFLAAIETNTFDLILADYSLPSFDGLSALGLAHERCPDVPFIFVSGALGEEVAIEALKNGATDYVLKDRLSRLAPAVRRALMERDDRAERRRVEEALRQQSEFLSNVFESIAQPFYVVDVQNYKIVMANSAAGWQEGHEGSTCYALAHHTEQPCDNEDHPCPLPRIMATKKPVIVEHFHNGPDGRTEIIEVHGYPLLNEKGEVVQMIEYCLDITDRRRLEKSVRSILEGTSAAVGADFVHNLVYHLASALGIRYALVAAADEDRMSARTLAIWSNDAHANNIVYPLAGTPCEAVLREGLCFYPERVQQLFPDSSLMKRMGVESFMGAPLLDSSGKQLGLLAVMDDKPMRDAAFIEALLNIFSARAATELERQSSEQALARLATVIEQAAEDIVIVDTQRRIEYVNPAFERTLGFARAEIEGLDVVDTLKGNARGNASYSKLRETVAAGRVWTGCVTLRRKDGTPIDEEATVSTIRDSNRKLIGYVAVMRDITERLKLEAQLRQAQKMEAIGTLAGGIAHDFNNILTIIGGNLDLAWEDVPPNSEALQESIGQAMQATARATDLVKQILAFSRQSQLERKPLLLNPLIKEVSKLLRSSIPATIEIEVRVPAAPIIVCGDLTQLHQVLMNLCTNAYHAMRGGNGKLTIELTETDGSGNKASGNLAGSWMRLRVRDTGKGMDAGILERIFEPFFTTKAQGEGTGLGLSVVHGIVESHGGTIQVSSEVGKGSTFDVFLPLWRESQPEGDEAPVSATIRGNGERILMVDDEEGIVSSMRRNLTRLGYRVFGTTSSLSALKKFRDDPGAFDLVITDQTMPQLTGLDMAREMLRLRPDCPVILCSGLAERISEAKIKEQGIAEFMKKPVKKQVLTETVRRALNARRSVEPPKE